MTTIINRLIATDNTTTEQIQSVLKNVLINPLPVILGTSFTATSSMKYLNLMCRGMNCEKGRRRGADVASYEKFKESDFLVSKKTKDQAAIASYNYHLTLIKGFIEKALQNSKRRIKTNNVAIAEIDLRISQIKAALSKTDIEIVINESLASFDKYSINLPQIKNYIAFHL